MAQRIRRNEIDNVFGPNQNQPLNEVEITDDLRHAFPVFDDPSLGTGGTKRPPLPQRGGGEEKRPGRFSRIKSGIDSVGDVLAEPSVGMALGRFAEAFGQGHEGSAATILGRGAQELSSERAQGEIARRLLSGEDISDIPAEMLATAGPEARQQIIQVAEQRADREQRGDDMEMRKELQERALDMQSRGLDLRAFGVMIEHEESMARLDANEIERRLGIAESANEINQQLADSLGKLRNAQIQALQVEQDGTSINPEVIMRETRELLDNLRRSTQIRQEQIDILRSDLERESGLATPETGFWGRAGRVITAFHRGEEVTSEDWKGWKEGVPTDEYAEIKGRLAIAEEDLAQQQELYDQLSKQQADMIRGIAPRQQQQTREAATPEQLRDREPLPTREEIQGRGAPEPQTPQSVDEITAYEAGTVFEWEGRIMMKESDDSFVDVTDQYRTD